MGSNALLAALNLSHSHDTPVLQLTWARQEPIGQTLTLTTAHHSISLLPPIQPTTLAHALAQLQLPPEPWQDWLLTTSEILARLPEIHDLTLHLASPSHHHSIKLNLQDPNSFSGCPNILAPIPTAQHTLALRNGETAILRSVRSEDAALIQQLIQAQSEHSRYTRFMTHTNELPIPTLARFSKLDYHSEAAWTARNSDDLIVAISRFSRINRNECEFGITLAENVRGKGLAAEMMKLIIQSATQQGYRVMSAQILKSNTPMLKLAEKSGFTITPSEEDNTLCQARLSLTTPQNSNKNK